MPRIDFIAPLAVTDADDRRVNDWSILSQCVGRMFECTDVLGFFGASDEEWTVGVLLERMGDMQILAGDQHDGLVARSSVRSARTLTVDELEILQKHVVGQWSDGFGECLELDGMNFYIDHEQVDRQQVDDGIALRGSGTPDLFPAIRERDIERVRAALDNGEDGNAFLGGMTALGWAIYGADVPIAHLLIDRGAVVHYRGYGPTTPLFWCAINSDLADDDAASIASRLLEIGGFESDEIEYAVDVASGGDKPQLLTVLNKYRSA